MNEFFRKLRRAGLRVEKTNGQHYEITNPAQPGPRVYCSGTPGDHRSVRNVESQVRRLLGVDLRRSK